MTNELNISDSWLIKDKHRRLFWSAEYHSFNPKCEQCESYYTDEQKVNTKLPTDGEWVKASYYGMKY